MLVYDDVSQMISIAQQNEDKLKPHACNLSFDIYSYLKSN